jgi:hypothetical protein
MHVDVQARGFVLTPALEMLVRRRATELGELTGHTAISLQVRLFEVNAARGGVDRGCLVAARLGRRNRIAVATSLAEDLYRAVQTAFDKLLCAALTPAHLGRSSRRQPPGKHVIPEA